MNKVLISWLGVTSDILPKGDVNPDGPTISFYKNFYSHDFHIILVTEDNLEKAYKFKKYVEQNFKNIYPIIKPQSIYGANWNLLEIKNKSEQVLLELTEYQIDILITTGSSMMKIAWILLHQNLALNTSIYHIVTYQDTQNKTKPELYKLDFSKSSIPYSAVVRQQLIALKKTEDQPVITESIKPVYQKAEKIAQAENLDILITGPFGSGKKTLAKFIHKNSSLRKKRPFISIDCAAYNDQLLEYKLFGYKRGAFPGAIHDYKGALTEANGGTIYLSNIDTLSPRLQHLLAKFLTDRIVDPIVGKEKKVNLRVIASTTKNFNELFKKSLLNKNLIYLFGIRLALPPLKNYSISEKKQIISTLLDQKLKQFKKNPKIELCPQLWDFFYSYQFPGNFTELNLLLDNLLVLSEDSKICTNELPDYIEKEEQPKSLLLSEVEKVHIEKALKLFNGNKSRTAKALGIALNTLKKKIKDYNIDLEQLLNS